MNGVDVSQQVLEELLLKQNQLEAQMLKPYDLPRHDLDREQYIDLDGTKNFYLHLTFGYSNPITDINFYYIAQKHESKLVSSFSVSSPFYDSFQRLCQQKRICNWCLCGDSMVRVLKSSITRHSRRAVQRSAMLSSSTDLTT